MDGRRWSSGKLIRTFLIAYAAETGLGVRYLDFGRGKKVSKIGLGTAQFGSAEWGYGEAYDKHGAHAIVRRALELGVTLFDTAEIYGAGHSERILGHALGEDRDSAFIADKIFPVAGGGPLIGWRARASARRIGVSRLDLYQVHYPSPLASDRAIMRGMRSLRDSGLIDEVGVSVYGLDRWRGAETALSGRVLSNQVAYNLIDRTAEQDLLPFAESGNRMIIAHSPLAQGLLSGRYHEADPPRDRYRAGSPYFHPEHLERTRKLIAVMREVASAHSAVPGQIALAWVVRRPCVVAIPGASSVEQLEKNVAAAEIHLTDEECRALEAASAAASHVAPHRSALRRKLHPLRHSARGARLVARTLRHDYLGLPDLQTPPRAYRSALEAAVPCRLPLTGSVARGSSASSARSIGHRASVKISRSP
jgi:aryl-alcohol dehydrogenase-like predicted oxidoreductase